MYGRNNGWATLDHCIVAFSGSGAAVAGDGTLDFSVSCSDVYGNIGGDWVGPIQDESGVNGNFRLDPAFCAYLNSSDPYALRDDSPCAPGNNPACGIVGARPVGCESAAQASLCTWGAIKSLFR